MLVVDNFDSFVYNLVQYLGQLGVRCVVRRNDAVTVDELGDLDVAGVLLSPGPGTPAGADGVAIMDQRLVATSAVRCVGNVLLLQGRTYSPPFVITAIGDIAAVRAELAASPQVAVFRQAVEDFGLTFTVRDRPEVVLPAYDAPLDMAYATPADG